MGVAKFKTQTWVVIVKLRTPQEIAPSRTVFPARNPLMSSRIHFRTSDGEIKRVVQIKGPTLIVPEGVESVEVIPIMGRTLIHGKNFKRKVTP